MATLRTTNLQHPASAVPNLVLQADGTVDGLGAGGLVKYASESDDTLRSTTSTTFVSGTIEIDYTPSAAGNLLLVEYDTSAACEQVSGTPGVRRMGVRVVEVGVGTVAGVDDNSAYGFELTPGAAGFPFRFPLYISGAVPAGSTATRTYRVEFATQDTRVQARLNAFAPGKISVTEINEGAI